MYLLPKMLVILVNPASPEDPSAVTCVPLAERGMGTNEEENGVAPGE